MPRNRWAFASKATVIGSARNVACTLVSMLLWCILSFTACNSSNSSQDLTVTGRFISADQKELLPLTLEVARTPQARELGLMYRQELPADRGMIFIYPSERPRSFWMKNTLISLDILYLDKDFTIVSLVENAIPHSLVSRTSQGHPAQYVIEIRGGLAAQKGITVGTKFEPLAPLPSGEDGV
jgi:uncharacterized membrane protein (UPF0127 family)